MKKLLRKTTILFITFSSAFSLLSHAQEIDFAQYRRDIDPPKVADFVGEASGDQPFVERITYTENFAFEEKTVLKKDIFRGTTKPNTFVRSDYTQFDEESMYLVGTTFSDASLGTIELKFNPPIEFPRHVTLGSTFTTSSTAKVQIGPIPATVTLQASFHFVSFETIEVPLGRFENALRLETVNNILLAGAPIATQSTIEWYHPLAGLVKTIDRIEDNTIALTSIDPPVEMDTFIKNWIQYMH